MNCDGHENTETHTAGPTERTSVNGRVESEKLQQRVGKGIEQNNEINRAFNKHHL